jgi:hypothetical protein
MIPADLFPTLVHIRLLSSGVVLLFSIGIEIGFAASGNRLIKVSQEQMYPPMVDLAPFFFISRLAFRMSKSQD